MCKRLTILFNMLLFTYAVGFAQLTENFSDGDFSANPVWQGSATNFTINSGFQLQTNLPTVPTTATTYYLSTANSLAAAAQWEFFVNLKFSTSGSNYVDVFLTASANDLMATTTQGYFVRIGNTNDNISLYRKDGPTSSVLISGINSSVNTSNNLIKIKVIRNAGNQFILYRDITGTGNSYVSEGSVIDNTYTTSVSFGFLIKQSTAAGAFNNHFFDDIVIQPYAPDIIPPAILSVAVTSAKTLDILFNEPIDAATVSATTNYLINNNIGSPSSAVIDANNPALIHLIFTNDFPDAVSCDISINGIKDLAGNIIGTAQHGFTYFAPYIPKQYDVVIDEIMVDPTPVVSLLNNEWIELKNTSGKMINLKNWRIGDATGISGPMPDYNLQPDSFIIICTGSAVTPISTFGNAISVTNFPSLDNTSDILFLQSPQGQTIHAVSYRSDWYQNELKKDGGWSLEMIDTKNPCTGINNWKASEDLRGGSPGKKNAIDAVIIDNSSPELVRAFAKDASTITIVFNEPLDSLKAIALANYSISDGIGMPSAAIAQAPLFDRVNLILTKALATNKIYTVTVNGITDCIGNTISINSTARVGLTDVADSLDIIINEILFNPKPNSTDYVEIYNRSNKVIDLSQTYIANRNTAGMIGSIAQLTPDTYLFFPGDFIVVSENTGMVKTNYITQDPDAFVQINTMPSFNDDKGDVIVLNAQGKITDELVYSEKWHFKLIDNNEGVALERIDYEGATQSQDNWHSAATSAGYGTPTYKNSQYRINDGLQGEVKITPKIISPDNDGQDDFATIEYNFPSSGYVANITIFDALGRPVRYVQKSALCGTKGNYRWDGLGEKGQQLPIGIYIAYTEIFNLQGKKKTFKDPIVLTRRN